MTTLPKLALTLIQPWGWLVANGLKNIENRPAGFSYKSFRGEFWIHAGLKDDPAHFLAAVELAERFGIKIPSLVGSEHFGCIIGRATIYDIIPPGHSGERWHFSAQWGFRIRDARSVKPVPCRGYQGFWTVPDGVLAQLARSE
jgi:hypothetical protein